MTHTTQTTALPGKYWVRLCALPKFSFLLSPAGGVARVEDACGNWVETSEVQQIVDDAEIRIAELEREKAALHYKALALEAQPSRECLQQSAEPAPATFMATDHACKWAWDQVRKDVGTEGWTTGDSCNFYGFFLWGWNYRGQYETQRPAARPAPAAVAVPAAIAPGMKAAADLVQEQADLYIAEHAETDPDTGAVIWHHRDYGFDWHNGLEELAQKLLARAALAAAPAQEHATQLAGQGQLQQRVQPWLLECFGAEIAGNKAERNHRFLEESLELVQSCGCTASEAHQLVDYVFGRPVGEPVQEVGGVMVTLAALCYANGLDMHAAGETELERISVPAIMAKIKAKQAAKPKHSPLPAEAQEDARIAKLTTAYTELSSMFHDQIVGQQAAYIEWQHGGGAEVAMGWIENGLCGPGHIPDEDDPYGKEAQAWFDANKSDPFPVCHCGRPSNQLWMGQGFCSTAHYDAARAAQGSAA